MQCSAIQSLRHKLAADEPVFGLWVTLEAPSITEMAAALGLDWVVIDAEHGHLDWKEIVEHLRATTRSNTVALVRIAELNSALIKRALDLGADGVVIPWIESADQLTQAVAYSKYPLEGVRGIGAERATGWGECLAEHTAQANDHVLVVPIIETVQAAQNISQLVEVNGVELYLFGPADFSSTAGYRGQWQGPNVANEILRCKDEIRRANMHCGLLASSEADLRDRLDQGFRMVGLGTDAGLLLRSIHSSLSVVGRDRRIRASLAVHEPSPVAAIARPDESLRPDRPERINSVGSGLVTEIAPGVVFECLVGGPWNARDLTTGLASFGGGAVLPYHTHPFTESITLVRGSAAVEVEGRRYTLHAFDNIVIPKGIAHKVDNQSPTEPAVLHVAMASDIPTRTLIDRPFTVRSMPRDFHGIPGMERVNRFHSALRCLADPDIEFIDFFNDGLIPGIEICGGYGLFHPGGRLPAHLSEFDESICVISGHATCVVEGRRYSMSDFASAFQPRGRIHYLMNESNRPMEFLWACAGPKAERIVVEESCATPDGNPWR